ncbi:MAG: hypothetical protein JO001_23165 [Alphaproteobacteria bacterium]|nr:hypothetical protein [Alphaproteobacteria bacterium]
MIDTTEEPRNRGWLNALMHPQLRPEINIGHLMQAVVVVTTVGGGIVGGYLSLRADVDLQRAEFRVALAGHEARLTVVERMLDERRIEDREFQSEMRGTLERVMQAIGDVRTELVQKQDRK